MLFGQNITNTLGTSGSFSIKDASAIYLSLNQSNGYLSLNRSLTIPNTTSSTTGVIYKGTESFIHNYQAPGTRGYNTFVGLNSGNFTLSGLGDQASYNTAMGYNNMVSLTTGYYNTAVGQNSMFYTTSGFNNTAMGVGSLAGNTTGNDNTAMGVYSLYFNTTGNFNSAFGISSLYSNTIGGYNSALGYRSLLSNTTGAQNSAFGTQSMFSNTSGNYNSAFGLNSLANNLTGNRNSSFGILSLNYNTTGSENSAFGSESLYSNTAGTHNSAFGFQSLYSGTTGVQNSAFGNYSLFNNTTGSYNLALGYYSGFSITTGSDNITIGYNAQVPNATSNNQVRIGNTLVSYAGIQVPWSITSDRRWKENILFLKLGLDFINKLRPVSYTRINQENPKTEYGLIAQEVEQALKQEGVENSGMLTVTDEGMYELRYNDLLSPMIKAIQELKAENDELKKKIESMESVEERLAKLEKYIIEQNNIKKVNSEINSAENQ